MLKISRHTFDLHVQYVVQFFQMSFLLLAAAAENVAAIFAFVFK